VKTREHKLSVERAGGIAVRHISKGNAFVAIKPLHQGNFPDAQGASAIIPNGERGL
jgi:hypothetical protein